MLDHKHPNVRHTDERALPSNPVVGRSSDPGEKGCGSGTCTFVKTWYEKAGVQTGARKNADVTVSDLKAEICPDCCGMFSSATSLLPMIVLGAKDKMGKIIEQVYLSGEDYTIYRTQQGVNVNFADCRARERKQRPCYEEISDKLCRLRFLTSQMARWPFGLWRRHGGFYDHQIAEAMYLALQNKPDRATQILNEGLILAEDRLINENRVRYLIACVLAALTPIIAVWLLLLSDAQHQEIMPYMMAGAAGAAGAVFSIAMRVLDLDLKTCVQSVLNYVMGALRVLTGCVAGVIILFIVNATVVGDAIIHLFKMTGSLHELSSWECIILLGFLGGFAERLVPVLLGTLQRDVEHPAADGSDSVGATEVTAETAKPNQLYRSRAQRKPANEHAVADHAADSAPSHRPQSK